MRSSSSHDDARYIELLGLAFTLNGTMEERAVALLDYVRLKILGDCEALFLSRDRFDFESRQVHMGRLEGSVRADKDPSIYQLLRSPYFLELINESYPAWAAHIIKESEMISTFWMCEAAAEEIDVDQLRREQFGPVGLEDLFGATAYVGNGYFLTIILPIHLGGMRPTLEQQQFLRTLPAVLAPILMAEQSASNENAWEAAANGRLSEAQSRVLELALQGMTEKEIALRLHRSHHTVNSHLRVIYRHYNVSSRAELMAMAINGNLKVG